MSYRSRAGTSSHNRKCGSSNYVVEPAPHGSELVWDIEKFFTATLTFRDDLSLCAYR